MCTKELGHPFHSNAASVPSDCCGPDARPRAADLRTENAAIRCDSIRLHRLLHLEDSLEAYYDRKRVWVLAAPPRTRREARDVAGQSRGPATDAPPAR